MDQQPPSMPRPSIFDPRSLLQETRSASHADVSVTDLFTDMHPEDSPQNRKGNMKHQTRRWFLKPSVWAFIVLVIVTGVSFCPALLANKRPFDFVLFDQPQPDTDGVGSSKATGQDY